MNRLIILHSGEDGTLVFDKEEAWFYYITNNGNKHPIGIYRPGNFDLTQDEMNAISNWIMRMLPDGVSEVRQTNS